MQPVSGAARPVVIAGDHHDRPRPAAPCAAARTAWKAWMIAGFIGRTEWNTSPAMTTMSGRNAITRSTATRNALADIRFALVDPGGRQPMVLAEAEMKVREVYEPHPAI